MQKCERMAHNLQNLQLNVKVAHDTNAKLEEQVRALSIVKFLDVVVLLFLRQQKQYDKWKFFAMN